jgi:tRNA(Ile)-lysidine synthase
MLDLISKVMRKVESALVNAINEHPEMPLVIAYSGGVDSQVLLHAISSLYHSNIISNPITVCHVNHGLSANATDWESFAKQECSKLNLTLDISRVNVQEKAQASLEALARDARYRVFHSIYTKPSIIITGHHSDDQTETFLLALKRGSGMKGLSAMASQAKHAKDWLIRPLLGITRKEIVSYAAEFGLSWVEDESNTDTRFDRNFIRNDIMPLLVNRWPSINNTINRSSDHCREGKLLLDELASEDLVNCENETHSLLVLPLIKLSQARFNNLIRYFLTRNNCLMPSTEQLAQLHQQLNANDDKNPAVKLGEYYFRRYKNALYLTRDFDDISEWSATITLCGTNNVISLPSQLGKLHCTQTGFSDDSKEGQQINVPNKDIKITIRFNHDNPNCLPDYRSHSRSLKKVLQELNIPPWQRKRIPFVYYDDVMVAAIGFFVCKEFVPKASSSKVLQYKLMPSEEMSSV